MDIQLSRVQRKGLVRQEASCRDTRRAVLWSCAIRKSQYHRFCIEVYGILFLALLVSTFASASRSHAGEPNAEIPSSLVLQRFDVAKEGGDLLVPVRLEGREHLLLVDTGSSFTGFDKALLHGKPRKVSKVETPTGMVEMAFYDPPEASVGSLSLGLRNTVACIDLEEIREVTGNATEGFLGMDWLGRHIVHVNFDQGIMSFLKSIPDNAGESFPLLWERGGVPHVSAEVSGMGLQFFRVDTGCAGFETGMLDSVSLRTLIKKKKAQKLGSLTGVAASGGFDSNTYNCGRLKLSQFVVNNAMFAEADGSNLLGIRFWSRFVVTFDFPGHKVFLRKGKNYERPDVWDSSGLHLSSKEGAKVIAEVDRGSPGALAGFEVGDVVLKVGDLRAAEVSLFELRSALATSQRATCEVRRGSDVRQLRFINGGGDQSLKR